MIRPAARSDLSAIVHVLARANATPYDITRVAEEKVFGRGYRGDPQPRVYVESDTILGVAVTCGKVLRLIAVDPDVRRRGIGSQLLGNEHIAFAEPGNYLTPGVIESDAATRAFFARHRFLEDRWTYNLEARLPPSHSEPFVQRALDPQTVNRVLTFAADHFSPIWRFEAELAPDNLFFIEHEGKIAGFSTHDANNHGLGTFGPTGVLEKFRGRGFGRALLLASLNDLARAGYTSAIIPWTDALDFYRRSCRAEVTSRFVTLVR